MITISLRFEEEMKKELDDMCDEMGMNLTTFFMIYAKKVLRERRIPFDIAAPSMSESFSNEPSSGNGRLPSTKKYNDILKSSKRDMNRSTKYDSGEYDVDYNNSYSEEEYEEYEHYDSDEYYDNATDIDTYIEEYDSGPPGINKQDANRDKPGGTKPYRRTTKESAVSSRRNTKSSIDKPDTSKTNSKGGKRQSKK